ncbi:MAG: hypothetical protein KDA45_14240, partial [Planctomycetales bacterium]|nr:hypothetical protein [Planctomycetales bacterium]
MFTLKNHSYGNPALLVAVSTTFLVASLLVPTSLQAAELLAGVAKVDVTDYEAGPANDPLYVKALMLKSDTETVVFVTVDAVAIGEIGPIPNEYLPNVRQRVQQELGIAPSSLLVNASHCHGIVRADTDELTVRAVREASQSLVPVKVGVGVGHEDRIMENRRVKLASGREADVRHAYALPPDDEVVEVGPVDPQIGILKLERQDGRVLAVVYNFAVHPIQGVPSGGNTADIIGFASKVIEDNTSEGTLALFLQGCGGDINPVFYKAVDHPRSAEPLGHMLGLSTLKALRQITCGDDQRLTLVSETLELPRGDRSERIFALETERERLLQSLTGTSLNLKTFLPLVVKQKLSGDFPSYYSHRYLYEAEQEQEDLRRLDAENRRNIERYIHNIHTMEELTRVQTNLRLLRKHQASLIDSGKRTVDVELSAVRIGDFVLTTFPGELTVPIGLNIKSKSPHPWTFVAGYTNGYIYYAPTTEQALNAGNAQEDCDCMLAPQWQGIYEAKAAE